MILRAGNFRFDVDYSKGTPDVWYLRNGDPGHPRAPPELHLNRCIWERSNGKEEELPPAVAEDIFDMVYNTLLDMAETPMTKNRVYLVTTNDSGAARLIEASSRAQAVRHAAAGRFDVTIPTPAEAFALAKQGINLEVASEDADGQQVAFEDGPVAKATAAGKK